MANAGQTNFNVNIDEKLSEIFAEQIDERGYRKYRALEAAIRAFLSFEPELQVLLMSNEVDAKKALAEQYQNQALAEYLQDIPQAQRKIALQGIKQLAARLSRRK